MPAAAVLPAPDTRMTASIQRHTLISFGGTRNKVSRIIRNHIDDLLRTTGHTSHTACALFPVDFNLSIGQLHRIKFTILDTIAEPYTAL